MPLPTGGPWPPRQIQPIYQRLVQWSAWHSGEPDRLAAVYGGMEGSDPGHTGFFASEHGGWAAKTTQAVVRWFWGQRPARTEKRAKLHIPLAGDIAGTSASLLFGDMPQIGFEDPATIALWDKHLAGDDLNSTLLEAADLSAAHGGVYLRVCWDRDVQPLPWLSPVHATAAIPEWAYGRLAAVTFWRVCGGGRGTVLRHLERYSVGQIEHGLYAGTHDELGEQMPLSADPSTRGIPVETTDGSLTGIVPTGVDRLACVYIPNVRPNRLWDHLPVGAPMGRADIQSNEGDLDALDEIWTSWLRDIRLGKGRLVVPAEYLEAQAAGSGAIFDPDREVYEAINSMGETGSSSGITVAQFAIRTQEHAAAADQMTKIILRGSGYNAATFGEDDTAATTATEIRAKQSRSYGTRGVKIGYMRPRLADIIETWLAVCVQVAGVTLTPERPDIEWPDAVTPDPQSQAQTLQLLRAAQAASTRTLVQMLHPDWDGGDVDAETARIGQEHAVANPDEFAGLPQPAAE